MKISGQQIDCLVMAAVAKSKEARDLEIKAIKRDKKLIALAKKYTKILNQIPKDIRVSMYIDKEEYRFINALVEKHKLKTNILNFQEVKNKIIIASIEVESLEELKRKLKLDF